MLSELIELNLLRLEQDLSYNELGRACGFKDPSLLHKLLNNKHRPTDRSLYKIRRYLDAHATRGKKGR